MTFKIALRNVFRNRRRTTFSLAVIVVGVAILFFGLGFIDEVLRSTKTSLACETGAVQIADARRFEGAGAGYDALIPPETLAHVLEMVEGRPGVVGVTWRLDFAGLVGDETGSTLVLARGVVPCNCVQDYACLVTDGAPIPEDASREVLLGRALAGKLNAAVGDRINVATGTVSGDFNAATVTVAGLVDTNLTEVEERLALFPLPFVQRLLRTDGVDRILVRLGDLDEAGVFAERLQGTLDAEGIRLATRTWQELSTAYDSLSSFYAAFSGLATLGVFVLVFFSVLEVLTMSFLERTREIGTIRAFGETRARVFRGFLLEGILLGALGGAIGVVIGVVVGSIFNAIGITWTPPGAAIPQAIALQIGAYVIVFPFATAVVSTSLSTLYPAWKNARLRVVEALRSL